MDPNQMTGDSQRIYRPALERSLRQLLNHNTVSGTFNDYELLRLYTWLRHGDARSKDSFASYFDANDRISDLILTAQADETNIKFIRNVVESLPDWPDSMRQAALMLGIVQKGQSDMELAMTQSSDRRDTWLLKFHAGQTYLKFNEDNVLELPTQVGLEGGIVTLPMRVFNTNAIKDILKRFERESTDISLDQYINAENRVMNLRNDINSKAFGKAAQELGINLSALTFSDLEQVERVHQILQSYLRNLFFRNRGVAVLKQLSLEYYGTSSERDMPAFVRQAVKAAEKIAEGKKQPPGGWRSPQKPIDLTELGTVTVKEPEDVPDIGLQVGEEISVSELLDKLNKLGLEPNALQEILKLEGASDAEIVEALGETLRNNCNQ